MFEKGAKKIKNFSKIDLEKMEDYEVISSFDDVVGSGVSLEAPKIWQFLPQKKVFKKPKQLFEESASKVKLIEKEIKKYETIRLWKRQKEEIIDHLKELVILYGQRDLAKTQEETEIIDEQIQDQERLVTIMKNIAAESQIDKHLHTSAKHAEYLTMQIIDQYEDRDKIRVVIPSSYDDYCRQTDLILSVNAQPTNDEKFVTYLSIDVTISFDEFEKKKKKILENIENKNYLRKKVKYFIDEDKVFFNKQLMMPFVFYLSLEKVNELRKQFLIDKEERKKEDQGEILEQKNIFYNEILQQIDNYENFINEMSKKILSAMKKEKISIWLAELKKIKEVFEKLILDSQNQEKSEQQVKKEKIGSAIRRRKVEK